MVDPSIPDASDAHAGALTAPELVGESAAITRIRELVRRVAATDTGVLLVAETGADVESVAREVHGLGRAAAPFVAVDGSAEGVDRLLFGERDGHAPSDLEPVGRGSCVAAGFGGTLFLQNVG